MVDINLRVIYRPEPSSLPQMYRTLGLDYDERYHACPHLAVIQRPPCPSLPRHLAIPSTLQRQVSRPNSPYATSHASHGKFLVHTR